MANENMPKEIKVGIPLGLGLIIIFVAIGSLIGRALSHGPQLPEQPAAQELKQGPPELGGGAGSPPVEAMGDTTPRRAQGETAAQGANAQGANAQGANAQGATAQGATAQGATAQGATAQGVAQPENAANQAPAPTKQGDTIAPRPTNPQDSAAQPEAAPVQGSGAATPDPQ